MVLRGKQYSWMEEFQLYMVSCDMSYYETVSFLMDGQHWVPIHPSTYVIEVQAEPRICALGF